MDSILSILSDFKFILRHIDKGHIRKHYFIKVFVTGGGCGGGLYVKGHFLPIRYTFTISHVVLRSLFVENYLPYLVSPRFDPTLSCPTMIQSDQVD